MTNNSITVNIDNLIENVLPERIIQALDDTCIYLVQEAQEKCPIVDGSGERGHIRESIDHTVIYENGVFKGRVGSNNEIAIYVHEGTGLYAIEGNGGKEVPWTYQDRKGKLHSTKDIQTKQFLREAIEENRDFILENFEGILTDD